MAMNPLFTETFDVKSSDNYGDFIARLRHRLGNPKHFSHNRPVLPPVEPNVPPRRWFHVVLTTQTNALTLATRADNLYLEGFRSSDGTWWELTRGLIPRATYVGFGGSYRDLLGDTDKLIDVDLGPQQMTEAVNVLAARTRTDLASVQKQQRAKDALVALLLMVHEATRFLTVSKKVSDLMHPKAAMKSGKITSQMKKQVNGWQDLSEALLKTDAWRGDEPSSDELLKSKKDALLKPKRDEPSSDELLKKDALQKTDARKGPFTRFKDMDVETAEKAAETVGILLFVDVPGGMTTATALRLFRES